MQQANRFSWQQTMLRVKDGEKSVQFYKEHFGMHLLDVYDFPEYKFKLYFLASLPEGQTLPEPGSVEAHKQLWNTEGVTLELTYNYDTEKDDNFKYHPGNQTYSEQQRDGFGHIAFHCDDVYKTCEELEKKGIQFKKKPDEGKMKGIAFAYDPDGYWIELIKRETGNVSGHTLGQTMIRVKDPKKSLDFYQRICGMQLVRESHYPDGQFSLYFLAHLPKGVTPPQDLQGQEAKQFASSQFNPVLELTHNHGTENDENFQYLNGNTEPYRGFGHIGFLVDDVFKACEELESQGIQFKKKPQDGNMKGLAFALDPDGYWVEIIKRGGYSDDFAPYYKE